VLRGAVLAAFAVGCVGAPSRIDHTALVAKQGAVEARRTLELRILRDPSDLAARLALAALCEEVGRPTAAIEQLEAVVTIGGPLGTRWRSEDRARLARLVAARGRARLARGAETALADLSRARSLGAAVDERELALARRARAIALLRHVDARERTAGHRLLRELSGTAAAEPAWAKWTAATLPAPRRGAYGAWLWAAGARRAAWEELDAWHAQTSPPRDPALQGAYLVARAWWMPDAAPRPGPDDLVGPERCRFMACDARAVLEDRDRDRGPDPAALAALVAAPPAPRATDAPQAAAWLAITLRQALRGEASWGPAFSARVDATAIAATALPPGARAAFARLAGRDGRGLDDGGGATGDLLAGAGRALSGAPPADVRSALGPLADTEEGRALLRIVDPPEPAGPRSLAAAAAAYARARVPWGPAAPALEALVDAYARDPAIADRLAQGAIAAAPDAAPAHAALGALFDALADPARARAAWQAAVDASPEPAFVRGLAEAAARAGDPDAALLHATTAAAASGDPAIVWIAVARALHGVGSHVHALEAARYAIELAGDAALAPALDVAIDGSRALGRTAQAESLAARRAAVAPPPLSSPTARDGDLTDASAALAAYRVQPSAAGVAWLFAASRWSLRDVAARAALRAALAVDDPRRRVVEVELAALAADPDPDVGRAAVAALR
jgi:hypothetical protein